MRSTKTKLVESALQVTRYQCDLVSGRWSLWSTHWSTSFKTHYNRFAEWSSSSRNQKNHYWILFAFFSSRFASSFTALIDHFDYVVRSHKSYDFCRRRTLETSYSVNGPFFSSLSSKMKKAKMIIRVQHQIERLSFDWNECLVRRPLLVSRNLHSSHSHSFGSPPIIELGLVLHQFFHGRSIHRQNSALQLRVAHLHSWNASSINP